MNKYSINLDNKAQAVVGDVANKEHKLAKIVETLPTENIDTNTIYMVLDQSASQQGNVYNEYLYINNAWELIGTTATSGTPKLIVDNITQLTGEQCELLEVGDIVIKRTDASKPGKFSRIYYNYFVVSSCSYGNNNVKENVFLTSVSNNYYVDIISYNKNNGEWAYYDSESREIPAILEGVELDEDEGQISLEEYQESTDAGYVSYFEQKLFKRVNVETMEEKYATFCSVPDKTGKYLVCEFRDPAESNIDSETGDPTEIDYTITEISVGGGGVTLYQHNILVEEFVQAQVLTTSATPFTLASFIQWLGNNQHPCNGMAHSMSEDGIYGSALYLFVDNNLLSTYLYDKPDSGNTWNYNFNDNVDLVFDDTVIQIQ